MAKITIIENKWMADAIKKSKTNRSKAREMDRKVRPEQTKDDRKRKTGRFTRFPKKKILMSI